MDTTTLVDRDEKDGSDLVLELDTHLTINAAFWFFVTDSDRWRLFIASPEVKKLGPKAVYQEVQNVLNARGKDYTISLQDISVISPDDPLVKLLRSAVKTGNQISSMRLRHNTINNVFIEDAYIYRMN